MGKIMLIAISIVAIILTLTVLFFNRADYHGKIIELEEDQFLLAPISIDPEAQYDFPVIHFSNDTKVTGKFNSNLDLKEGQEVKLWVEDTEFKGIKVANKIKVVKNLKHFLFDIKSIESITKNTKLNIVLGYLSHVQHL
jgi:hypothetical protein